MGFMKDGSYLINLIPFYNQATQLVDEGKAVPEARVEKGSGTVTGMEMVWFVEEEAQGRPYHSLRLLVVRWGSASST